MAGVTAVGAGMVIVGAGECGGSAALALREAGYDGPVTLVGAEKHLPYERPPLSKEAMASPGAPVPRNMAGADRLGDLDIGFVRGNPAVAIDRDARTVMLRDGSALPYERLLLATGCAARRLPGVAPSPRVVCLRSFEDALAIRSHIAPGRRIAIIGGGFIGLEVAASARRRGAEVTVVEAQERILKRGVPAEIAEAVHDLHAREGVEIIAGTPIASVEAGGTHVAIALRDGTRIEADIAVTGIGAVPATELAAGAGLAVDDGIAVDARLRTSDPDIFAAGDCCSFPLAIYGGRRVRLECWRNAREQGALAARNMSGGEEHHAAVPWFWSDQYDASLHIAGLADEGAATARRELGGGAFVLFHLAGDGRLVAASGFGPGNAVAKDIRLAEMLIARRCTPERGLLAAPDFRLKSLLAA